MKHNFCAGPAVLPQEVIEKSAKAVFDFAGTGISLLSISHRSKEFKPVVDEAEALIKEILDIPEGYSVLFLAGGASMEFCRVPFNFLNKKAAYLNTGVWAKKALKEATDRFAARFTKAEALALADGKVVTELSEAEWDEYYVKAKKALK